MTKDEGQRKARDLYIFRRYTIEELADLLGYSELYIASVKHGQQPIRELFRLKAAHYLPEPQDVLFAPERREDDDTRAGSA